MASAEFTCARFNTRLAQLTDPRHGLVLATGVPNAYELAARPKPPSRSQLRPLVIISGPSRAGKDSLVGSLLKRGTYHQVKTATSRQRRNNVEAPDAMVWMRQRRPGEAPDAYRAALVREYGLVEHDDHHGDIYGLPRRNLAVAIGRIPLLNIDTRGIRTLRSALRSTHRITAIMICPDSAGSLVKRMNELGTRASARLGVAQQYLHEAPGLVDYVLLNRQRSNPRRAIAEARSSVESILQRENVL